MDPIRLTSNLITTGQSDNVACAAGYIPCCEDRMTQATPQRPWAQWYGLQRWRNRAAMQMKEHPLCVACLAKNKVEPATTADHIVRHQGDPIEFWFGKLQSLCSSCHSNSKQQMEIKGFVNDIGEDGWPSDGNHPVYGKKE